MYFSVKKVVTASWQINIFPSVFSAPHLPPMVGFGVWVFCCCCAGYSNTSSQKEQTPVCKCFESQFSEKYQKEKPVLNLSRHVTYFSAVQNPCSVSFLTFVKCSENDSCTNADLHSFTLYSWPPGPQYGHQRSSFHMRGVWKQAGLALSKEIIKREWETINFLPSPPQPLCFKDTPETICTLSEQKCFYYRNPPPSTWIVARAFWTSAQSQHFGLQENKHQIVCLFGSRCSSHLEVPFLPFASVISLLTSSSECSFRPIGDK